MWKILYLFSFLHDGLEKRERMFTHLKTKVWLPPKFFQVPIVFTRPSFNNETDQMNHRYSLFLSPLFPPHAYFPNFIRLAQYSKSLRILTSFCTFSITKLLIDKRYLSWVNKLPHKRNYNIITLHECVLIKISTKRTYKKCHTVNSPTRRTESYKLIYWDAHLLLHLLTFVFVYNLFKAKNLSECSKKFHQLRSSAVNKFFFYFFYWAEVYYSQFIT